MEQITKDLRLISLAGIAWLHEHDLGAKASILNAEIDKDELAKAIDRISVMIEWLNSHLIFQPVKPPALAFYCNAHKLATNNPINCVQGKETETYCRISTI